MGYDPTGNWDWGGVIVGLSLVAAGVITIGSCGSGAPIGAMLVAAVTATGAVTTYAATTDSVMVVDVSGAASAIRGRKVGASVVVDFKMIMPIFIRIRERLLVIQSDYRLLIRLGWSIIIQNQRIMPVLLQMSMEGL